MPGPSESSFTQLIGEVRSGDEPARTALFNLFSDWLIAQVRSRMMARGVVDPIASAGDAALSAFGEFLEDFAHGAFPQLSTREDLKAILTWLAGKKLSRQQRRQKAAKRGRARVRGEATLEGAPCDSGAPGLDGFPGDEPPPASRMEIVEELDRIRRALDDEGLSQVFDLMLEGYIRQPSGYTDVEIAQKLGYSDRTIRRKIALIKELALGSEGP